MAAQAREAALRALLEVTAGGAALPDALARHRQRLADARDQALLSEIVTGTLRWQARLDHLIARAASRPLADIDPAVRAVLRLSAYQLGHLERVPARAVVSDAVDLVRGARAGRAAGFVNAVLRTLVRTPPDALLPPRPEGSATDEAALDYLSVTLSHPRWLMRRWLHRYGFDAAEVWARFNNQPAALTLRANMLRVDRDTLSEALATHGVRVRPATYAPDGLLVTAGNPLTTPLSARGLFLVQDEASQLVAAVAGARPGQRVLDACAAPGGKSVALAAAIGPAGRLVAADRRRRRLSLLKSTLAACGAAASVVQLDLTSGLPFGAAFDLVLVDAPCSGLGTLRRDPDVRWRREEADLERMAAMQVRMLEQAAGGVRAGGRLVYATCSSEPEENDGVIGRFLERNRGFGSVDLRAPGERPVPGEVLDAAGRLSTSPALHGLEAFYAAVLRRDAP